MTTEKDRTPQDDPAVKPPPRQHDPLDDALADSFPASDPVAPAVPPQSVKADEKQRKER
jgi:hypothetical protein